MRTTMIEMLSEKPVSVLGVGAMPLAESRADGSMMAWDDAVAVLHHAFDIGYSLIDTADIYAPDAANIGYDERLVGDAVASWSGGRDALVVVTKIGITRTADPSGGDDDGWGRDGSRDYLLRAAEASVTRLGFVPDAILLHRVNRDQQPFDVTVRNMVAVREAGLATRIGIGNVHLDECVIAWDASEGTIAAVENERSPRYRDDVDVVHWAGQHGVAYLPWSPLGGGDDARHLGEMHPEFASVANELSSGAAPGTAVTPQQVALAWLLAAGSHVVPIPAFTRAATADASAAAADLVLSADEVSRLDASTSDLGSLFPD